MPLPRRRLPALVAAGLFAGCPSGDGTPATSAGTPTDAGSPTPDGPPHSPSGDCRPRTPQPVSDLSVTNDAADAVTATVAVRRAVGTGGIATATPLYERTHSLSAGETVEVDDVLPEVDTYRVTVALENGTTESADVEGGPTRYGLVEIRIDGPDAIDAGWLHVVPPATPTPCP